MSRGCLLSYREWEDGDEEPGDGGKLAFLGLWRTMKKKKKKRRE